LIKFSLALKTDDVFFQLFGVPVWNESVPPPELIGNSHHVYQDEK
jgi:hypothetical protein